MRSWLKVLLPELQLIDVVAEFGLVRQASAAPQLPTALVSPGGTPAAVGVGVAPTGAMTPAPGVLAPLPAPAVKPKEIERRTADVNSALKQALSLYPVVAGRLAAAAGRWLAGGTAVDRPAGIILLAGPAGVGKSFIAKAFARILSEQHLSAAVPYEEIDLADYSDAGAAEPLFRERLLPLALQRQRRVYAFAHLEAASPAVLEVLQELAVTAQVRVAGQSLRTDGCFLLFMSTRAADAPAGATEVPPELADRLGLRFCAAIQTAIVLPPPGATQVELLCAAQAKALAGQLHSQSGVSLTFTSAALTAVADRAAERGGFGHGVESVLAEAVRLPVADLRATGALRPEPAEVDWDAGFFARQGAVRHRLWSSGQEVTAGEGALAKLDQVIGWEPVKEFVRTLCATVRLQRERRSQGLPAPAQALHMVFTGNPGTGKTTVARLIARALREAGVLRSGHLVEVARQDLVAGYVGHTAPLVRATLERALGGVLFIDEAYTLARGDGDPFGLEAIDALVKAMEDYREDLVVIVAGYTDEMESFLRANPGLRSRFPYTVEFPDYSPDQLLLILERLVAQQGLQLAPGAAGAAATELQRRQIPGRRDAGNGRLARNLLEEAVRRQAERLGATAPSDATILSLLQAEDFAPKVQQDPFDLEAELAKIVGLKPVKQMLCTLQKQVAADVRRRQAGLTEATRQSLNMLFLGNPGTGKTTVARVVARLLREMGVLKSGHLVETDRAGLVAGYAGQTAGLVRTLVERSLGGILFIDEAYALSRGGDPFGQEAVDTLVKLMEEHRSDLVVILAGYPREMQAFLQANPGLRSRFPLQVEFPDYTPAELGQIALREVGARGFRLADGLPDDIAEAIARRNVQGQSDQGNGRLVRNLVEEAIRRQSVRIADLTEASPEDLITLTAADFAVGAPAEGSSSALVELDQVIGLDGVKSFARGLHAQLVLDRRRRELGLPVSGDRTLHMVFEGNPGTGKTTVARILAQLLRELGLLKSGHLVEADRSSLVAGYMGQTAIKTREKIEAALGGVLFIDEAYALFTDERDSFGREALDTLVKGMEDHRDSLVVILAGYPDQTERMLAGNPGLRSRFPNVIPFRDYSASQLLAMAKQQIASRGLHLDDSAQAKLELLCGHAAAGPQGGNGRFVRNLVERAQRRQAMRLGGVAAASRAELQTLTESDLDERREEGTG